MILEVSALSKSMGSKELFNNLTFSIDDGEKIALIGRNGLGKTTLLRLLSGEDVDYVGIIKRRKNLQVIMTKQEHSDDPSISALTYILRSVPRYFDCEKVMQEFETGILTDVQLYSEVLDIFTRSGYFFIKDKILGTLRDFQITEEKATQSFVHLSGGEKRYVELARMMYSQAGLFLVDEPTNHMDYLGKEQFISWMKEGTKSVLVVTHDRDVLKYVDKIIELKDRRLYVFNGNYDRYLTQNAAQTTNSVIRYRNQLNRLKEAKKRVEWGLSMRAKSKEWKIRYDHWVKEYEKIKAETVKPSFWIDQDSTDLLQSDITASYLKYKEKNITIGIHRETTRTTELVTIRELSLGYGEPLFSGLSFSVRNDDRVFIRGKNGAGKSSLVRAILSTYRQEQTNVTLFEGNILTGINLRIGEYEQEINPKYLQLTLENAILEAYGEMGVPLEDRQMKGLLAQYLFDPVADGRQKIADLSGGQKARFQIIKMLAAKPNLLVLDEPTNHLDLPSIEELENSLSNFQGGILYISHDSYFINRMGGETVELL